MEARWQMEYQRHEDDECFDVGVPLPDGSFVQIEHASVDTAKETLGVWSCPSGDATTALEEMKSKAQEWLDRAKEGKLGRRDIWFLV